MKDAPLADRMRPRTLDDVVGQDHLLGPERPLRLGLEAGRLPSMILWGPPGCGKTTLATLLAERAGLRLRSLSAVMAGMKALKMLIEDCRTAHRLSEARTVLFIDEIHRWNKAQQDALLPHIEQGVIVLIGATTENPAAELISALRSRAEVLALRPLQVRDLVSLMQRALEDREYGLGSRGLSAEFGALERVGRLAGGDARRALNLLERLAGGVRDGQTITAELAAERLGRPEILYDRDGEEHYALVSAMVKSMRGSDPDAALYWLARLLRGGEDPIFLARRVLIFAAEDIGNADPQALNLATSAATAVQLLGMPEARSPLAQAVVYLATAPKSNAVMRGLKAALAEVDRSGPLPVPMHLRRTTGTGYKYPHDYSYGIVRQVYVPPRIRDKRFYLPRSWGYERSIRERLDWWQEKLEALEAEEQED